MEVFVYSDGLGGIFGYASLSDFVRGGKLVELDVSERTLRGYFSDGSNVCFGVRFIPNRWLRRVEVDKRERKRVRPKYLFGKEY